MRGLWTHFQDVQTSGKWASDSDVKSAAAACLADSARGLEARMEQNAIDEELMKLTRQTRGE
jgi:hypothetical protein